MPPGANRLCIANTDPDHAHRFFWMHANYDYAIHEAAVPAAGAACFDSEFLLGLGRYLKALVQLYDDRYQTAGEEVSSPPVDMGPEDTGRRVDFRFVLDRAGHGYAFRSQGRP